MTRTLRIGISPCPNDTFIFHALAHNLVGALGIDFDFHFADVEELNHAALGPHGPHVTKLSVHAAALARPAYALLRSGAALGRGCGPVLVAREPGKTLADLADATIAIPGRNTTANLLLALTGVHHGPTLELVFDRIMDAVLDRRADAGLIIHEGRFTFADHGLYLVQDMGAWWEAAFNLPLPLGAIAARRDLPRETALAVQAAIRQSLEYAFAHPEASRDWIKSHAQELDEHTTTRHIRTFVNDYSLDIGPDGEHAMDTLVQKATQLAGLAAAENGKPEPPLFLG
ncbi:MAG: 1,4-dihydroxy-6-naphthoate synthase [Desulfovibrionaceae bacterium]|jgi:1,4-dihydroxy-6-naphthoate synthase|nr:1,4-dihydroxy-6-naphthoate synthase [Desulfovibrionaceae bacterium]